MSCSAILPKKPLSWEQSRNQDGSGLYCLIKVSVLFQPFVCFWSCFRSLAVNSVLGLVSEAWQSILFLVLFQKPGSQLCFWSCFRSSAVNFVSLLLLLLFSCPLFFFIDGNVVFVLLQSRAARRQREAGGRTVRTYYGSGSPAPLLQMSPQQVVFIARFGTSR